MVILGIASIVAVAQSRALFASKCLLAKSACVSLFHLFLFFCFVLTSFTSTGLLGLNSQGERPKGQLKLVPGLLVLSRDGIDVSVYHLASSCFILSGFFNKPNGSSRRGAVVNESD